MVRPASHLFPQRSTVLLFFLAVLLVLPACGLKPVPVQEPGVGAGKHESGQAVSGYGTVVHLAFDGGFGIIADDGTKLDPAGLPESCRVDGLRVAFTGVITNGPTTRMWGRRIQITSISPM
jgi:hypothetical protein